MKDLPGAAVPSRMSIRTRLGLQGPVAWRKLWLGVLLFYLLKGICWGALGYLVFSH
jgi:hypothetical protein